MPNFVQAPCQNKQTPDYQHKHIFTTVRYRTKTYENGHSQADTSAQKAPYPQRDQRGQECLAIGVFRVVVALYALSHTDIISEDNALYFMLGALIKRQGLKFDRVFYATVWAIIPLIALCYFPSNLDRGTLGGIAITYLAISFLLSLYPHLPKRAKEISEFVGRNTLPLLLFSPIFTHLSKPLVPVLSFDSTGLLFTAVAVLFTVMGSFAIAWLIDKSGLSRFFWGNREKFSWKGLSPLSQK